MGKPNGILFHSYINGVIVHLFEVIEKVTYTYRGIVKLTVNPYQAEQLDETGNNGEFKDGWEFPGDKVEDDETSQQALVRDIKEELNVDIKVRKWLSNVEYGYPKFHLSTDCFLCRVKSGKLVLREDNVEWLSADQ